MLRTEIQPDPIISDPSDLRPEGELSLLDLAALLVAHKRFLLRFVAAAAVLSTIVAFLLPVRYEANIVLLPPAQNSSLGSSLLGQLGNLGSLGSLASLAGGNLNLKNPADMYVSLLTSRTVVIISHRPASLALADRVLRLEHGELREAEPASA